ncbi:MAG: hypothetical protein JW993_00665 [Sedimentisphaerales bacterium]|nr:hypothetical protein [Sedimentisphaerales bacterium]
MSRKGMGWAMGWILVTWGTATAPADTPMGPPIAVLEEGHWAASLEYGYGESDLRAYGLSTTALTGESPTSAFEMLDIEGLRSHQVLAGLAYGVCDNWDLFLRVGIADVQDDILAGSAQRWAYSGTGFAWGLGSRATFCQWGPWSFGGLAQVTWLDPDSSVFSSVDPEEANRVSVGSIDLDLWQTQVSLAAAYQIDTLSFWAGPFLEFTEGELERSGRVLTDGVDSGSFMATSQIEERSQFGLHFGVQWEKSDALSAWVGGQLTSDSWSIGVGGIIQPQRWGNRR